MHPFPLLNQECGGHKFKEGTVVTQWLKTQIMEFHQQGRKMRPHDLIKVMTVVGLCAVVVGQKHG
jgi:hypothetical protein